MPSPQDYMRFWEHMELTAGFTVSGVLALGNGDERNRFRGHNWQRVTNSQTDSST